MSDEKLHKAFNDAVNLVNSYTKPLPADLLLKLYAYYRIANDNYNHPGSRTPLINAFKANALIQAKNLSKEEAMESYIALVNKEVKKFIG
ncbi:MULTISPECIES: acyl-CoA-binding protein [Flavobacteriaceae]|uniref:acyl-CoA-binding protein n=1 Tax=Flavobacteriaceae TaxID=49546 RepID=UPI0010AEC609|nr:MULTISPECIES: acyl-CoA-binding protein [Flavobacteriaceae]NJB35973.1 acyl-CoA-binding protein [Croceivirga sp. JEA036]TKD59041.1 acyl-CoA-binding protein [Flavobacterium sp. ASW18X]